MVQRSRDRRSVKRKQESTVTSGRIIIFWTDPRASCRDHDMSFLSCLLSSLHGSGYGQTHLTYFDPADGKWKIYSRQSDMVLKYVRGNASDVMMLRLPINQPQYFKVDSSSGYARVIFVEKNPSQQELAVIYETGAPTSQMKQWLL